MRIFLLLLSVCAFANHPFFYPPLGWEIVRPKEPNPYVQIGFLGKGSTDFRPSLSLALEEVDSTLKEYVKSVKEIHLADRKQYRDLGKFAMKGGEGRLIELTEKNGWGVVKMLQAILIKGSTAYLLTGAVLKEDFPRFQAEFLKSFRTLDVIADLSTPIADDQKRKKFQDFFASLGCHPTDHAAPRPNDDASAGTSGKDPEKTLVRIPHQEWEQLQAEVGNFAELGPYWQFLALQQGHIKIFSPQE